MTEISQALIMAAGYATRMRPLTDNLPKPLLKVDGQPMLTHIINHLIAEDVTKIIVNGYHALEPLRNYMEDIARAYPQCDFILSEETELLETGGGAVLANQYLTPDEPFYMINGDAYWINHIKETSLGELSQKWTASKYDILLLLQSCASMAMTEAIGDYDIKDGFATRLINKSGEYMFTGVRVCMPYVLEKYNIEKFSFLKMMDDTESKNRLGGVNHNGEWYHISIPSDLDEVNDVLCKVKRA